jgi:hypothetical protein
MEKMKGTFERRIESSYLSRPLYNFSSRNLDLQGYGVGTEESYEDYFIFYDPDTLRVYHLLPDSILNLFILSGYELVEKRWKDQNSFCKLKRFGETIYIFTEPDEWLLRLYSDPEKEVIIKMEGYSSLLFYKQNKHIKHLSLEEINELFKIMLKEVLNNYIKFSSSEPTYIL